MHTIEALRRYKQYLAASQDQFRPARDPVMDAAKDAVVAMFHRARTERVTRAKTVLIERIGTLAEELIATSAWLFVVDENRANAEITFHSPNHNCSINLDEDGVVARCANTQSPYLINAVKDCAFYRQISPSTQSEAAFPVVGSDGATIAVLNMESVQVGQFDEIEIDVISHRVLEISPYVESLRGLSTNDPFAAPWYFEDGWSLSETARLFCEGLASAVCADTASCTVWNSDHTFSELRALATHNYDYRFLAERYLEKRDSFTGTVVRSMPGVVLRGAPDTAPNFHDVPRSLVMGVRNVASTPMQLASSSDDTCDSALSLYSSFHGADGIQLPCDETMRSLARAFEQVAGSFSRYRFRVAKLALTSAFRQVAKERSTHSVLRLLVGMLECDSVVVAINEHKDVSDWRFASVLAPEANWLAKGERAIRELVTKIFESSNIALATTGYRQEPHQLAFKLALDGYDLVLSFVRDNQRLPFSRLDFRFAREIVDILIPLTEDLSFKSAIALDLDLSELYHAKSLCTQRVGLPRSVPAKSHEWEIVNYPATRQAYLDYIEAGGYDDAFNTFRILIGCREVESSYQIQDELVTPLVPNSGPPLVSRPDMHAWLVMYAAFAKSRMGEHKTAIALREQATSYYRESGTLLEFAIAAGAVAHMDLIPLGEYREAERVLEFSLKLAREARAPDAGFQEAVLALEYARLRFSSRAQVRAGTTLCSGQSQA